MTHAPSFRRSVFALAVALCPLAAQDERESTQPVDQIFQVNAGVSNIDGYISQGYRITDIEIFDSAAPRFSVTLVRNTAGYDVSGWWWYYGLTSVDVRNHLTQNQARPIDIESYLDGNGTRRFAVVMVSNTGAAAKNWYLFLGSATTTISDYLATNGYRLVDIDGYTSGGARVYAAIAIRNAGADARGWWWYLGASQTQVTNLLSQNGARLVDLDPVGNGTYEVIMNRTSGVWGYYFGQSASAITQIVNQYGRRIVDIEPATNSTFDVIVNNNLDARGTRVSQILNTGATGYLGAYLRRVDGNDSTVLVALNEGTRFEPASTLKTLPHAYAMYECSRNQLSLGSNITVGLGTVGSCPTGGAPYVTETVGDSLRFMMENSDNARTKRIVDLLGVSAINSFAGILGMPRTSINHVLGCGGPPSNWTTLEDLASLHDYVADGRITGFRNQFYELMVNTRSYPTVGTLSIESIITAEAASEGVSGSSLTAFRDAITYAAKGGNYDWPSTPRFHGSYFGTISLPFVIAGRVVHQQYAVGAFFNDSTDKTVAFNAISGAYCEMLREEIRYALRGWRNYVVGSHTVFGTACAGSNGTPTTGGSGTPGVGSVVGYWTDGGPRAMPAVMFLGTSKSLWNSIPLPFDLGSFGAGGCQVLTDPALGLPLTTNAQGRVSGQLQIPPDVGLLGLRFHVQFWIVDPPANQLGLITTRGVTTLIGVGS